MGSELSLTVALPAREARRRAAEQQPLADYGSSNRVELKSEKSAMQMIRCSECKLEIPASALVCGFCGFDYEAMELRVAEDNRRRSAQRADEFDVVVANFPHRSVFIAAVIMASVLTLNKLLDPSDPDALSWPGIVFGAPAGAYFMVFVWRIVMVRLRGRP